MTPAPIAIRVSMPDGDDAALDAAGSAGTPKDEAADRSVGLLVVVANSLASLEEAGTVVKKGVLDSTIGRAVGAAEMDSIEVTLVGIALWPKGLVVRVGLLDALAALEVLAAATEELLSSSLSEPSSSRRSSLR